MSHTRDKFRTMLILFALLLLPALLAGCGTLELGLEGGATPYGEEQEQEQELDQGQRAAATATGEANPVPRASPRAETLTGGMIITGTAARLDFPSGWVEMVTDDTEEDDEDGGMVQVRITEWTRVRDTEGAVLAREDLRRGARLRVSATEQGEALMADQVVMLSPGVPELEDNPAYTDVTGQVTPIAEAQPAGEGTIRLFEVASEHPIADPGATVTLRWAFEGETGTICEQITPRPMTDTCYQDLPPSGALEVTVPAEAQGAVGYFLYVPAGQDVEQALAVLPLSAERGCEHEWFFSNAAYPLKPLLACPTSAPVEIRPQAQPFERGLMVRLQDPTLGEEAWLITLLPQESGTYALGFEPVVDGWEAGMPETDPALAPPEGLLQPSRGFGMLWRGEIEYQPMGEVMTLDGEALLGWATGSVFEYEGVYQCFEGTHGRGQSCLMSGPEGTVLPMPVTASTG